MKEEAIDRVMVGPVGPSLTWTGHGWHIEQRKGSCRVLHGRASAGGRMEIDN